MVEELIQEYGYLAVFLGTLLEGEIILILAGFAAHRGFLELPWVMLAAFVGSVCGDQLFFWLGRRHGRWLLARGPHWEPRLERVRKLARRWLIPVILGFRFIYGIRSITPFALGLGAVSARLFSGLNILGAAVWSVLGALGGYFLGEIMEAVIGEIKRYELYILGTLTLLGAVVWLIHRWRVRRGK